MSKSSAHAGIRLRGVRHNNLKNFDLDLPLNQLIVVTGLSGSGKSSLAFDTLFAEGQRRYIETFSPYARQFFDRMDKPQVDSIEGIPPAIAIEQRNAVKTTRSTVGTMTELCDYMKLLWPHIAQLYCRQCGQPVRKDSPQQIWESLTNSELRIPSSEILVTFNLPLSEKLSLEESLDLITKQGYQRLLVTVTRENPALNPFSALQLNEAKAPWGKLQVPVNPSPSTLGADAHLAREQFPSGEGSGVGSLPRRAARAAGFEIVRIDEAVERLNELRPTSLDAPLEPGKAGVPQTRNVRAPWTDHSHLRAARSQALGQRQAEVIEHPVPVRDESNLHRPARAQAGRRVTRAPPSA